MIVDFSFPWLYKFCVKASAIDICPGSCWHNPIESVNKAYATASDILEVHECRFRPNISLALRTYCWFNVKLLKSILQLESRRLYFHNKGTNWLIGSTSIREAYIANCHQTSIAVEPGTPSEVHDLIYGYNLTTIDDKRTIDSGNLLERISLWWYAESFLSSSTTRGKVFAI